MINKQNLWFITLFSLIMVLSIYYLTISDNNLANLNLKQTDKVSGEVVISEDETLVALKVASEDAMLKKTQELENILLDDTSTVEEKNDAYDELQSLNKNESAKENIIKTIKNKFSLDSFVEIEGSNITITIAKKTHDATLANNIIREVQSLYDESKYITVKFS